METWRDTAVICGAEVRRSLRSARAIVLFLLYAGFTAMALLVVHGIARSIDAQVAQANLDPEAARLGLEQARRSFVGTFFGGDDERMTEALLSVPLVLLVVFKSSLRFLPLFIAVMGFDQISGEVGPRSIRYLAVRTRRSSILLGKFLAQAGLLALLMLVVDAALCLYAWRTQDGFTLGAAAATFGRFWGAAAAFSLAYLALTTLCSALFRQPAVSLVVNFLALFGIWLLAFVGDLARMAAAAGQTTSPFAALRFASVWHYSTDLMHPALAQAATAAGAHLGFAALFLGAALLVLRRRDL